MDEAAVLATISALELGELQKAVNPKEEASVKTFNLRAQEHNQKTQEFNTRARELNALAGEIRSASESYDTGCASRDFRASDREAILKESAKP